MELKELIRQNRTYRRFDQSVPVSMADLEDLVDLARLTSCANNNQAMKYVLVSDPEMCEVVFQNIKWAAALADWSGPQEGEKPTAYIIPFHDESVSKNILWDLGLAVQSMTLGASEKGLGCCQFGNVNFPKLKADLGFNEEHLKPLMVLAIGKPVEKVVLTEIPETGKTTYWRDANQVHYVPKRTLEEITLKKY